MQADPAREYLGRSDSAACDRWEPLAPGLCTQTPQAKGSPSESATESKQEPREINRYHHQCCLTFLC